MSMMNTEYLIEYFKEHRQMPPEVLNFEKWCEAVKPLGIDEKTAGGLVALYNMHTSEVALATNIINNYLQACNIDIAMQHNDMVKQGNDIQLKGIKNQERIAECLEDRNKIGLLANDELAKANQIREENLGVQRESFEWTKQQTVLTVDPQTGRLVNRGMTQADYYNQLMSGEDNSQQMQSYGQQPSYQQPNNANNTRRGGGGYSYV